MDGKTNDTSTIKVCSIMMMQMLDELSRTRALSDRETDLLETLVNRGHQPTGINRINWTTELDRKLIRAATRGKLPIRAFADRHGFGHQAVYDRLHKLRKAKSTIPDRRFKD